jgi:hypothetical protein
MLSVFSNVMSKNDVDYRADDEGETLMIDSFAEGDSSDDQSRVSTVMMYM